MNYFLAGLNDAQMLAFHGQFCSRCAAHCDEGDVMLCSLAVALMNLCDTIRGKIGVDYDVALKKFAK
jgi:hypothetical protein